jgi:hypothetical protein
MHNTGFIIDKTTFPAARLFSLAQLINFGIPMITTLASLAFAAMLLYAAFIWLTAGDKKDSVAKAWKIMTFAVLGLVLVLFSYAFVKIILVVFKVNNLVPL